MSTALSNLESQEAALINQIAAIEKQLSKAVEINNQLEASALLQTYMYYKQERPKKLQSVLQEMEKILYKNEEELAVETQQLNEQSQNLENEAQEIYSECEDKRQQLALILKQISTMREFPKSAENIPPSFDKMCSQQVEQLARQFASMVDDVDQQDLVMLLARGKSDFDIDQIIEKARTLGQIRYQVKCMTLVIQVLEKANETLRKMDYENFPNIANGSHELSQVLDRISNELSNITQDEDAQPELPNVDAKMEQISSLQNQLHVLRQRLQNSLSSDATFPMPPEISNSEMEKEAMKECINALKQSTQSFIEYLNKIDSENIVDSRIATEEEVRNILKRYEELKQLNVN